MKLKLNVYERFLLRGVYASIERGGNMREQVAKTNLDAAIMLSIDEWEKYDVKINKDANEQEYTTWNDKGREQVEINVHRIGVEVLCEKALEMLDGDNKIPSAMFACIINFLKQVKDNEEAGSINKEIIDKINEKLSWMEDLDNFKNE